MGRFLKISRVVAAIVCLLLLSLTLTGAVAALSSPGSLIARMQILPAAMAFSMGWFILWLMVTLLLGRVYCSTVCPLGSLMDIFSRLSRKGSPGREYSYQMPLSKLRYIAFGIVIIAILADILVIVSLVDPYSAYERIAENIESPTIAAAHNVVAEAGQWTGWWSTPLVKVVITSFLSLVVAVVTLVVVAWISWRNGRLLCNTICPVGTTLGFISRYSILHFDIDTDLCTQCRRCEYACKSSCIDLNDHLVDGSRCVNCFNCVAACPTGALRYTTDRHQLSIPMMQRTRGRLARPTAITAGTVSGAGSANEMKQSSDKADISDETIS